MVSFNQPRGLTHGPEGNSPHGKVLSAGRNQGGLRRGLVLEWLADFRALASHPAKRVDIDTFAYRCGKALTPLDR
jgi:hypothetical protein